MILDEKLQQFLTHQGVAWEVTPSARHFSLEREWEAVYGNVWSLSMRQKQGLRAQEEYGRCKAPVFLIVPFLGDHAGPHGLGRREADRCVGYECRSTGKSPDMSAFSDIDFFICDPDLNWTMVHTHEDYALGGPYFIRRAWLVPPTRRR